MLERRQDGRLAHEVLQRLGAIFGGDAVWAISLTATAGRLLLVAGLVDGAHAALRDAAQNAVAILQAARRSEPADTICGAAGPEGGATRACPQWAQKVRAGAVGALAKGTERPGEFAQRLGQHPA